MHTTRNILTFSLLTLLLGLTTACETRVVSANGISYYTFQKQQRNEVRQQREQAREEGWFASLFKPKKQAPEFGEFWSILIAPIEEPNHRQIAQDLADNLTQQTQLEDFWVNAENERSVVYFGKYENVRTKDAQRDRDILKTYARSGQIPPANLILVPVNIVDRGAHPEYELSAAAKQGGIYTLQIAYFEDPDKRERAKKAAEDYVLELRSKNEPAFYSHGKNRSMVTIGVFDQNAVIRRKDNFGRLQAFYAPEVEQLLVKYPYHAANGEQVVIANTASGQKAAQKPFLVKIPGASNNTQRSAWGNRYKVNYGGAANQR